MMEDKEAERLFEEIKGEVYRNFVAKLKGRMESILENRVADLLKEEITTWMAENIVPELRAYLVSSRGAILSQVKAAADQIGITVAQAMLRRMKETFGDAWRADKILKEIFR